MTCLCLCSAFHALPPVLETLIAGGCFLGGVEQPLCPHAAPGSDSPLGHLYARHRVWQSCVSFVGVCPARLWPVLYQAAPCSSALLFQKPHLKRGGTSSEYYPRLIGSNTSEAAPEMSCALFKKGRVLLPSLNLTLLAYEIFFSPGWQGVA